MDANGARGNKCLDEDAGDGDEEGGEREAAEAEAEAAVAAAEKQDAEDTDEGFGRRDVVADNGDDQAKSTGGQVERNLLLANWTWTWTCTH